MFNVAAILLNAHFQTTLEILHDSSTHLFLDSPNVTCDVYFQVSNGSRLILIYIVFAVPAKKIIQGCWVWGMGRTFIRGLQAHNLIIKLIFQPQSVFQRSVWGCPVLLQPL